MPTHDTWTHAELFEGLDPAPSFVTELERVGLLRVVARDRAGAALYAADAKDELAKVLSLVELGYQPKDIAAIARKVGLPARRKRSFFARTPVFLRIEALAERAGVTAPQLEGWVTRGLVEPSFQTEGGESLFALADAPVVQALADLVRLQAADEDLAGFASLARAVDPANEGSPAPELLGSAEPLLKRLGTLLEETKAATRRTDKLLAVCRKRVGRARRVTAPGDDSAPRTGRRKSVRTRARGRKGPGRDDNV